MILERQRKVGGKTNLAVQPAKPVRTKPDLPKYSNQIPEETPDEKWEKEPQDYDARSSHICIHTLVYSHYQIHAHTTSLFHSPSLHV